MAIQKEDQKLPFKTNDRLMQVNALLEHPAILSTFIKLPFVIKIFVLSIFEWPLKTGFTVFGIGECNCSMVECLTLDQEFPV